MNLKIKMRKILVSAALLYCNIYTKRTVSIKINIILVISHNKRNEIRENLRSDAYLSFF